MVFVNCSVFNHSSNKTIFPWSIVSLGVPGITVQQFYHEKVLRCLEEQSEQELESAFLGKSKDSLDRIELSLPLDAVIPTFDPFLRYYTADRLQQLPPVVNAFTVMMSSQKKQLQPGLPGSVTVRTRKDELYNDFLEMLKEENLLFPGAEINTSGKNFVKTMVECLWYVDGHHETLKKQSASIPERFTRFNGYNLPQLSKHRKRQSSNLSSASCPQIVGIITVSKSSSIFLE